MFIILCRVTVIGVAIWKSWLCNFDHFWNSRSCSELFEDLSIFLSQLFVSEWEEFEAEREELALWLADLDVRLTKVDHLTGNTCEKLRLLQVCYSTLMHVLWSIFLFVDLFVFMCVCLQSFQQCVCVNSGRVNALLRRGEALIQRSQPNDAQHVESRLLELLRCCSHVYNNIARTHTRLLSMRLVHTRRSKYTHEGGTEDTLAV